MEFQISRQISNSCLSNIYYDLVILVAGYEQRSIYLPKNYSIKAGKKCALAFTEKSKETLRKNNDAFLISQGYSLLPVSGEELIDLHSILDEVIRNSKNEEIFILADYSSMTKIWYSGIINFLTSYENSKKKIIVHFNYTPAVYTELRKKGPIKFNNRISIASRRNIDPSKPTALFIGLGLDNSRAEYIKKTLNPELTYLVYADPTNDLKYVEKVFKNNRTIIEETEVRNFVSFPLNNLDKTYDTITNLCLCLREKYNIVIAPLGPKVLSLLSLILASRYPDINVIRLSYGSNAPAQDRIPIGEPLIYSVEFVSDDVE